MSNSNIITKLLPLLLGFFVMGFCDIVGVGSDYVQRSFGWSDSMTGFVPSMVFIWFLFLAIPFGNLMNKIGRKNTVVISMVVTIVGMLLPLVVYDSTTCVIAFALLGIGNTILQVSLNPLVSNVITDGRLLTSSLTAGQVVKALSSLLGPEFVILAVSQWGEDKWYLCFPMLGAITLITALWLVATPIRNENEDENEKKNLDLGATFSLLKDNTILLLFLGILFVVGLDVSVNFISSKLMAARFDWTAEQQKWAPQTYFLCRTIGALLGSYLLSRVAGVKYFRWNIAACVGAVLVLMFVSHAMTDLVCIGAIGFLASSVFSIIYSEALQAQPTKANEISGLMITAISGGAIVSPVLGFAIENGGMTGGVGVILLCAMYLAFCAFRLK